MASVLDNRITYLPGVGQQRALVLEREIGVRTYRDLLYYFPFKHIDRTRFYSIAEVSEHLSYVQIRCTLVSMNVEGQKRRKRLVARVVDGSGHELELVWFNSITYFAKRLRIGIPYVVFGKPTRYGSTINIVHPEIDPLKEGERKAGGLYPVYSTTDRMKRAGLTSKAIHELVSKVLGYISGGLPDTLPGYIVDHYNMLSLSEALLSVHMPADQRSLVRATTRLKFEELFYVRLRMRYLVNKRQEEVVGITIDRVGSGFHTLYNENLPFALTTAQKRVLREIYDDMRSGAQMNRLLQGDVGSGKTVVALLAMLLAVDNGYQACLMAPTEILATQHYVGIHEMLVGMDLSVRLLTGSTTARTKREIADKLASGEIKILIGTHALIEPYVQFAHLGLAVIDEQHRFGVYQRSVMWDKNVLNPPHILIMSATPIPRTLAMTLYGDLDVSVIDELPPGRTPIITRHFFEGKRRDVYFFMKDQISKGRQIYVVYPLIEESKKLKYKSVEEGFENIKECFPDVPVAMLHGQMRPQDKEQTMSRFVRGEIKILVATTVIEVGVNVPNATVMVIESAERFGLSQLHQLRGRVGRGSEQSYCILLTGEAIGEEARRRMGIMSETTNGFVVAEEDLKIRGYGDMEGTQQSGMGMDLKIANLAKDSRIVQFCVTLVEHILEDDPLLTDPKNKVLSEQLAQILERNKDWGLIS